jgi:dienelactone hydrolase
MKTQSIEYEDGNVTLRGVVAFDDATSHQRPGVLVMPEAFGLGTHATQRAERLASLGYVALAGDPYGNGLEVTDLQEAIKRASALREDPATFRQRARVALDTLASLPQVDASRLAAIGYCLGGTFALELARDGAPCGAWSPFTAGWRHHGPPWPGRSRRRSWSAPAPMIRLSRWRRSTPWPRK